VSRELGPPARALIDTNNIKMTRTDNASTIEKLKVYRDGSENREVREQKKQRR